MPSEVIVIGGGVIGCAIAHELSRRGRRVNLLADRALASGATWASGGMLVPFVEAHTGAMLELGARSLALYDSFVASVRADAPDAEEFEYARPGSLQVTLRGESLAPMRAAAAALAARGIRAAWVSGEELRLSEPQLSDAVTGGLLIHDHGIVGAERLTEALWSAAEAKGARFTPARVTAIRRTGTDLLVEASGAHVYGDTVVLAPGAWMSTIKIEGATAAPVLPVRGQLLRLRWHEEADTPRLIVWGPRCYLIPWRDRRLLVGATLEHVGFDERNTAAGVHDLLEAAAELVPHVWTATFEGARVGLRPGTPDDLPIIGRSAEMPGLIYAAGHYRNGVLLAPITARLVADLIVDGREDELLSHFSPDRFGGHDVDAVTH